MINAFDCTMFAASIGRSFLAIDQCPAGVTANAFDNFIVNPGSRYNFDSVFEFIVWINYWIV